MGYMRPDLEGFWAARRIDAFDGLCPRAVPSSGLR